MGIPKRFLALIGHGTTGQDTTGKDDIERGIRLRWAFRREMGFPLGCFRLYRRQSGEYGRPVCYDFQKMREPEVRKPLKLGPEKKPTIISSTLWPLSFESRPASNGPSPRREQVLVVPPRAQLEVSLSECAYCVTVNAMFAVPGRLTVVAYAGGVQVDQSSIQVGSAARHSVTVQASAIDTVKLSGLSAALVQVCYVPCERCEDHEAGGWEELRDSICLPICYSDDPCKEPYHEPDCEWLNVEDRLPDDACIRSRYGGERAQELVSVLRTVVDPEGLTAQADRFIEAPSIAEDCPPPAQKQPTINFRALDAVLLSATDPIIARVLGLYYVDDKAEAGTSYDYKIVGDWPEGTLWHLTESLRFDKLPIRYRLPLNIFPIGELIFRTGLRPTVIKKPSKSAGTKNALAFRHTDDFDWNLPGLTNLPVSKFPVVQVEIRFAEPVGEVQIHIGQQTPNVTMVAWGERDNPVNELLGKVSLVGQEMNNRIPIEIHIEGPNANLYSITENMLTGKILIQNDNTFRIVSNTAGVFQYDLRFSIEVELNQPTNTNPPTVGSCSIVTEPSRQREDVLAAHGYLPTDRITRIELKGNDFWIYKIFWQEERIPHGEHCAFVYGLRREDAEALKPPQNVNAFALPGIMQKVADCQPLMEGQTVDARYSVGVRWELPLMQNQLLPKSPIRYHVRRIAQDGTENLLTEDSPVFVTPANQDVEKARKENLPEGWPQDTPYYVESGLEPGEYRYQVAGVDLFGRMSDFSAPSNAVSPVPLPPPSPPNVTARFIDGKDPWLSKEDRDALPQGIADAVAIRLRWNWPEDYERMAPDVQTFKVYYLPGVPNILFGNVIDIDIDNATSTYVDIEAEIEGLGTALAPENLLVGRLLNQGGKAFRILTHREGIAQDSKQVLVARLLLPPSPPENRPVEGDCSIALAASIAIEVSDFSESGGDINAVIKSTAIHAVPHSGLETSRLTIGQIEAVIDAVNRATLTDGHFELEVQLTIAEPDKKELFLSIPTPFFARLSLTEPGTGIYKDYSKAISWPTALSETIPKIGTGQYDLLMREKVSGETPGLIATDPGEYTLIVDQFLPGFDVHLDNPRFESHFGISATGQGGQGPVSMPAGVTRIYRGDKTKQGEVLNTLRPPIAPEDIVLEGPPNFEGKLTYEFSWTRTSGWRYELYRALDDTLFQVDQSIREDIQTNRIPLRFQSINERTDWLLNFPAANRQPILDFIINPVELDLQAIENSPDRNILLQALASLPFNDRAFTKLNDKYVKPAENGPDNTMICIDDSIEGKAEGRYFYRVQAIDSVGNAAPMAISTPPIYVPGDQRPAIPVITAVEGGDRQITIRWVCNPDPSVSEYHIYRSESEDDARDLRRMITVAVFAVDPGLSARPALVEWTDENVQGLTDFWYRVMAVRIDRMSALGGSYASKPSPSVKVRAVDTSPPDPARFTRTEWIKLDASGGEHPWVDPVTPFTPAICLEWTGVTPGDESMVQRKPDGALVWANITDWTSALNHRDVEVEASSTYRYRIKVRRPNGQTGLSQVAVVEGN